MTRVDRVEPDLNTAVPGDPRDTTTPAQSAADLRAVLLGDALDPDDRALLRSAMAGTTTGDGTIRAACRTGGRSRTRPGRRRTGCATTSRSCSLPRDPIVLVVFTTRDGAGADAEPSDALVAAAARVAVRSIGAASG